MIFRSCRGLARRRGRSPRRRATQRKQEQGETGPRVVVEPAEQPEVEEREPPVLSLDVDVGQEVRARRQELSELDERRAELLEPAAKRPRSLTRRVGPADHADLGKDSPQSALVCEPPDGQSAPSALKTCAHDGLCHRWRPGKRRRGRACRLPGLEEAAAVAHSVNAVEAVEAVDAEASEEVRKERCDEQQVDEP